MNRKDEQSSARETDSGKVLPDIEGAESGESSDRTLFQVSTSGALVAGLYQGAVSTAVVLQHGDFGLGTFADLDGETGLALGHLP